MDQSMDYEWFQIYESDHLLRRKQRIQYEENYAAQDLNCRHQYEYELITNMVNTAMKAGMEKEDLIKMVGREFEAFYADMREDKRRLRENFQQRRENFQKIEQEFFNGKDAEEETIEEDEEEVLKEEACQQPDELAQSEEAEQSIEPDQKNEELAQSAPKPICLNPSTLDTANSSFSVGGYSVAAQSAGKYRYLNPSTLDNTNHEKQVASPPYPAQSENRKPSPQKPNIRILKQQPHRPFYTAIANKRRRH